MDDRDRIKKYLPLIIAGAILWLIIVSLIISFIFGSLTKDTGDSYISTETPFTSDISDEINTEMKNIEEPFLSDGYVPVEDVDDLLEKEIEYVETQKTKGNITYYEKGSNCIYMELNTGHALVYIPEIKDYKSGESLNRIVTLQPNYDELGKNKSADTAASTIEKKCSNYSFKDKDNLDNSEVTLKSIEELAGASVVIWDGHGGYTNKIHSFLSTDIDFDSVSSSKEYADDCDDKIIIECNGKAMITGDFFKKHLKKNSLDSAIIYLGTCHSGKDDYLANILINKGAKCVFGNTDTTTVEYDSAMTKSIFTELAKGKPCSSALKSAKSKNGKKCEGGDSEVKIFGTSNAKLKSKSSSTTTVKYNYNPIENALGYAKNFDSGMMKFSFHDNKLYFSETPSAPTKIKFFSLSDQTVHSATTINSEVGKNVSVDVCTDGALILKIPDKSPYEKNEIKYSIYDFDSKKTLHTDAVGYLLYSDYVNGYCYYLGEAGYDISKLSPSNHKATTIYYNYPSGSESEPFDYACTIGSNTFITEYAKITDDYYGLYNQKIKLITGKSSAKTVIKKLDNMNVYSNDNSLFYFNENKLYEYNVNTNKNKEIASVSKDIHPYYIYFVYGSRAYFSEITDNGVLNIYFVDLTTNKTNSIISCDLGSNYTQDHSN